MRRAVWGICTAEAMTMQRTLELLKLGEIWIKDTLRRLKHICVICNSLSIQDCAQLGLNPIHRSQFFLWQKILAAKRIPEKAREHIRTASSQIPSSFFYFIFFQFHQFASAEYLRTYQRTKQKLTQMYPVPYFYDSCKQDTSDIKARPNPMRGFNIPPTVYEEELFSMPSAFFEDAAPKKKFNRYSDEMLDGFHSFWEGQREVMARAQGLDYCAQTGSAMSKQGARKSPQPRIPSAPFSQLRGRRTLVTKLRAMYNMMLESARVAVENAMDVEFRAVKELKDIDFEDTAAYSRAERKLKLALAYVQKAMDRKAEIENDPLFGHPQDDAAEADSKVDTEESQAEAIPMDLNDYLAAEPKLADPEEVGSMVVELATGVECDLGDNDSFVTCCPPPPAPTPWSAPQLPTPPQSGSHVDAQPLTVTAEPKRRFRFFRRKAQAGAQKQRGTFRSALWQLAMTVLGKAPVSGDLKDRPHHRSLRGFFSFFEV